VLSLALLGMTGQYWAELIEVINAMKNQKRALVTGGAGLIGSHVADLLVREGWRVRILDNLEPNTHKRGKPAWINRDAEFVQGDLRDRGTIENALHAGDREIRAREFARHGANARTHSGKKSPDPKSDRCQLTSSL
jgi:nucleoside-diphosphate-sugar epimerase